MICNRRGKRAIQWHIVERWREGFRKREGLKKNKLVQFSNLGSCHTGAVVTLGQLSTWAVVLPGQLSNLGSCLTWAVVYLGSCCLGSCLPGQLSPGQLSVHRIFTKQLLFMSHAQKFHQTRNPPWLSSRNWMSVSVNPDELLLVPWQDLILLQEQCCAGYSQYCFLSHSQLCRQLL